MCLGEECREVSNVGRKHQCTWYLSYPLKHCIETSCGLIFDEGVMLTRYIHGVQRSSMSLAPAGDKHEMTLPTLEAFLKRIAFPPESFLRAGLDALCAA